MRRTDRREQTRENILAAAAEAFAESGFQGANLDEVAARAGVTKPTVYAHFGSKEGLCEALVVGWIERLQADHVLRFDPDVDPKLALVDFGVAQTREILDPKHLGLFRAVLAEMLRRPEWAADMLGRMPDKGLETWLRDGPTVDIVAPTAGVVGAPTATMTPLVSRWI